MPDPVWFWQRIVSPHMAGLAAALAATGREVVYVAEQAMSVERQAQGWTSPSPGAAQLRFAPDAAAVAALATEAPERSIHICQGFRGNGKVNVARAILARRKLRQWIVMEAVDEQGFLSMVAKRAVYRLHIRRWRRRIEGVLATGRVTPGWLAARGMPAGRIFPFAYFLPDHLVSTPARQEQDRLRLLYVGQLIKRKRVDLLLDSIAGLPADAVELTIVGGGPSECDLRRHAEEKLPGIVRWTGSRPITEIPALMAGADCLVLPSRHDGWGAVVSEALMAGTRAICSDHCGVAGVVAASGRGGVFRSGDAADLTRLLHNEIRQGPQTPEQRTQLSGWATCLGASAGARYLTQILARTTSGDVRPVPPWLEKVEQA